MKPFSSRLEAFSLVEVTLAIGVAAFALLAILGLLPVGINNNQASIQQTAATNIATAMIADMNQVPSASTIVANGSLSKTSNVYGIDVTQSSTITLFLDDSGAVVPSVDKARYKATVTLTQPANNQRNATTGNIKIGWPAAAANPTGYIFVFVALDRN